MHIAVFTGAFPLVSETFVIGHIARLLNVGHKVDVYANSRPPAGQPVHPDVERHTLLSRTTYMDAPAESGYWELPVLPLRGKTWPPDGSQAQFNAMRVLRAAPALARSVSASPSLTAQVLDTAEYGHEAASLSALYRLARLSKIRKHYDVLHAHFGPIGSAFRFCRQLWKAPMVVTFHGYDFSTYPLQHGKDVFAPLFRTADLLTVNSRYAGQRLQEIGCATGKLRELHMGVDASEYTFRERAYAAGQPVRLITVARLTEKKGLEYSLRAFASVAQTRRELRYEVIGDGPLYSELSSLARDLGVAAQVVWHGAQSATFVRERLAAAHIFVLTSVTAANGDQEGTPVSLMEAQASGLPVLSTAHSGIPEVVLHGVSGLLVPERDIEATSDAMRRLLDQLHRWGDMGRAGRQHIERNYNTALLDGVLLRIYEEAIARSALGTQ